VKKAFKEVDPDIVLLPISPEEIKGLKACVDGKVKEMALSHLEEMYAKRMRKYGKVAVPPPYLAQAFILTRDSGVKLKAVDMDENTFTDFFLKSVSTVDQIVHSQRMRFMKRKKFKATTAEEFSMRWDAYINKTTGFRVVELQREIVIAANISRTPKKYKRALAFVELERFEGIKKNLLKALGQ